MITLIPLSQKKVLKLFYENKNKKIHLREICRLTKLHEPSVSRILKKLEKEKILNYKKTANLKQYYIKKNVHSFIIFEMFDLEKFENISKIRQKAIKIFYKNLKEKPLFVILFGSTAKNNYKKNSDIDLLLITNKKINKKIIEKAIIETESLTSIKIDVFQITYKDFIEEIKLKEDKTIQSAIKTGYPIINNIEYYKVLYDEY